MSKYSQNISDELRANFGSIYGRIPEKAEVLDFGCSSGYQGELLIKDKGCTVDGTEIDAADARAARKVLRKVYEFDLDDTAGWPKGLLAKRYDVLNFGDVLEHLEQPQAVLTKAKRLLKKDGVVLISVPNIAHLSVRLELLQGSFIYEPRGILDNTHLKYFTLQTLSEMIAAAGFKVDELDYTIKEYPEAVVTELLARAGLKANGSGAWDKLVASKEARAFQYKLAISVGSMSDKPLRAPKADEFRDAHIAVLEARSKEVAALGNEVEKLKQHIELIYASRSWRYSQKLRRLLGRK